MSHSGVRYTGIIVGTFVLGLGALAGEAESVPCFAIRDVSASASAGRQLRTADMNGDARTDVVGIFGGGLGESLIAWYENLGGTTPELVERTVAVGSDPQYFDVTDMDGDGDVDLTVAVGGDGRVLWYENSGGSEPTFEEAILAVAREPLEFLQTTDLDQDGLPDVVGVAGDSLIWYANDSMSPPGFDGETIASGMDLARSLTVADVNGDGLDDLIVTRGFSPSELLVFRNLGGPEPRFREHLLESTFRSFGSVSAADMDQDGDTDILTTRTEDGETVISVWDNRGGLTPRFLERVVGVAPHSVGIVGQDLDGDGDGDILLLGSTANEISWLEQRSDGPPSFSWHIVTTATFQPKDVTAADIDGDSLVDLVSLATQGFDLAWYSQTVPLDQQLLLSRGELRRGEVVELEVAGAFPGESVHLVGSSRGTTTGKTQPSLGGGCLSVASPAPVLGTSVAGLDGVAVFELSVPPELGASELAMQAVVHRGDDGAESVASNVVVAPIESP